MSHITHYLNSSDIVLFLVKHPTAIQKHPRTHKDTHTHTYTQTDPFCRLLKMVAQVHLLHSLSGQTGWWCQLPHTHALSLSLIYTHALSSLSLSYIHTLSLSLSYIHSHTHTLSLSYTHTHAHTDTLLYIHTHSLSLHSTPPPYPTLTLTSWSSISSHDWSINKQVFSQSMCCSHPS